MRRSKAFAHSAAMRILLTNDDGIDAPGLTWSARYDAFGRRVDKTVNGIAVNTPADIDTALAALLA